MNQSTFLYEREEQFEVKLNGESIYVVSKPGLLDWGITHPSTTLLVEYSSIQSTDKVFLIGGPQGDLSVYLARRLSAGHLTVSDIDFLCLEMTRKTLARNKIHSVKFSAEIDILQDEYDHYDTVLMHNPKGRALARRWMVQAYNVLKKGGSLYLAGSNKSGIHSVIKDASELFGNVRILGYKKGNRIAHLIKNPTTTNQPAWVNTPGISPKTWFEFPITLEDHRIQIRSLPGVFSYDRLDAGTEMLLSVVKIPAGKNILDVGCGYGVIGLFAAIHGAGWVDLVDNNLLAVASARENLLLNHIPNAAVFAGDLLNPVRSQLYELILSNPPFHISHGVDFQIAEAMIRQSFHALASPGQLIIVANRFLPYDRLIKDIFSNVHTLEKSGKFHVLSGLK